MIIPILKILLSVIVCIYILLILFLIYGTGRRKYPRNRVTEPLISIIIAARNEAHNLLDCLQSLTNLVYPQNKLEIIIVDDNSTDSSLEVIQAFTRKYPHFHYISVDEKQSHLTGKANAIDLAVQKSHGEIILLTDADCVVPPDWACTYNSYFTENIGLVSGMTVLDRRKDQSSVLGKVQSLDWLYLIGVGISAARNGMPLSCVGNNFAFRRCVYDEIGGYRQIGFSITEDFSFLNAIITRTKWQVRFSFNKKIVVTSKPVLEIKELFHQRKRWAMGSKYVRFLGKLLLLSSGLFHLIWPFVLFEGSNHLSSISLFVVVIMADFLYLFRVTSLLNRRDLLKYFLFFEIYYFFYTSFYAFILLLNDRVTWKGKIYNVRTGKIVDC